MPFNVSVSGRMAPALPGALSLHTIDTLSRSLKSLGAHLDDAVAPAVAAGGLRNRKIGRARELRSAGKHNGRYRRTSRPRSNQSRQGGTGIPSRMLDPGRGSNRDFQCVYGFPFKDVVNIRAYPRKESVTCGGMD